MRLRLEIKTGPYSGKIIPVLEGRVVTVGRTKLSEIEIPNDTYLSKVHFSVECNANVCRLVDHKSANGTLLNGARVTEAIIHDRDEIKAGQTVFAVQLVQDTALETPPVVSQSEVSHTVPGAAPQEKTWPATKRRRTQSALTIGNWSFQRIPEGWVVDEGSGIHFAGKGAFPSHLVATEERIAGDVTLQAHIDSQLAFVRELVLEPEIEMARSIKIAGAEAAMAVVIRYKTDDGRRFFQRQIYARSASSVGVLTFTTVEDMLPQTQSVFDAIIATVRFRENPNDAGNG